MSETLLLVFISFLVSHLEELFSSNMTYISLCDCRIFRKTFHHLIHFLTAIVAISFLKMYAVAIFLLYMKRALLRNSPAFLQGEGSRPCPRRRGQIFQPLPSLSLKDTDKSASDAVLYFPICAAFPQIPTCIH